MKIRNRAKRAAIRGHILMIFLVLLFAYPFIYMVSTSFKSMTEIFQSGMNIVMEKK